MKKMIHFEIKKLIDKKVLILFFLLFVLNITYICFSHIDFVSSQFYQGKRSITENVEGLITQDKVDFLLNGYEKNKKLVDLGQYNSEVGDKNTYTGYIYGDMNAFEEVYMDLIRVYNYGDKINEKKDIINENIEKSNKTENYSLFLKNRLDERNIASYYGTVGIQKYLEYTDSIIFVLIILLFSGINYLYYDRNFKMDKIIDITKNGMFKLKLVRYTLLLTFMVIIALLFFLSDYIVFCSLYNIKGLGNPIYSLSVFSSTYFKISIFLYVLLLNFIKITGVLCVSCLILFLSKKTANTYITTIISFIVSLIMWLYLYKSGSSFSIESLSRIFSIHRVGSFFIHDIYFIILSQYILFICLSLFYLRKGPIKK